MKAENDHGYFSLVRDILTSRYGPLAISPVRSNLCVKLAVKNLLNMLYASPNDSPSLFLKGAISNFLRKSRREVFFKKCLFHFQAMFRYDQSPFVL